MFVSYAAEDAEWVRVLAGNLHACGLEVFFDEWDIAAGARLSQRLQEGLASSRAVVLVVSAAAVKTERWQEEFAAAMAAVTAQRQRLVPVLLDEVGLPPFVAARQCADFRHVDSPDAYRAALEQLVRALRGQPQADRPAEGDGIVVPPTSYRVEGPRLARLRISCDEVVFSTGDTKTRHAPAGVDYGLQTAVWEIGAGPFPVGEHAAACRRAGSGGALHVALLEIGRKLGVRFLDGPAGRALAEQAALAGGRVLRLAVQVDDPALADLPWETLVLPGQDEPVVLQTGVELYRAVPVGDPVAIPVPGPLRILAVVASPDFGGGELLDYEAELGRILAAVDRTRRSEGAYVRVLNWGSPQSRSGRR